MIIKMQFKQDCCDDFFHPCHEKEHKEIHCKVDNKLIKDCISCEWNVPEGETQTIFQTSGFEQVFGSGFVSFDFGHSDFILVRFFIDDCQVGDDIYVFQDSCVAFTYTKFNRIRVTCPSGSICDCDGEFDDDFDCEGEICITTRFPVC